MYNVLIAEDELLVRLGLKNSIEWEKYSMTIAADTNNGLIAWDLYQSLKPDILLTDLRMPGIDGMELIRRIREKDKDIYIIIITCVEDFELLRQAMSMGVAAYIVKVSMTEEEIEIILQKAQNEIKSKKTSHKNDSTPSFNVHEVREAFLREILSPNAFVACSSRNENDVFDWAIDRYRMVMALVEIDSQKEKPLLLSVNERRTIIQSILDILNNTLEDSNNSEAFYWDNNRFLLVIDFYNMHSEQQIWTYLHSILNRIQSLIFGYFNISTSIAVSNIGSGIQWLRDAYSDCSAFMEARYILGPGQILQREKLNLKTAATRFIKPLIDKHELFNWLSESEISLYNSKVEQILVASLESNDKVQNALLQLVHLLVEYTKKRLSDAAEIPEKYHSAVFKADTLQNAIKYCLQLMDECAASLSRYCSYRKEIKDTIRFMEQNFHYELNLKDLAQNVELSPNYLCTLFKQETKTNLVEYLALLRIEKAKELLAATPLRINEVALRTGFSDETYFSRVFQKVVGMSPTVWRAASARGERI